jgi:ubiquinone/menaquinone biosynthesis C-methylase UbiE
MSDWSIENLFAEPVVNLGEHAQPEFNGILTPESTLTNALDSSIQVYDIDKAAIYNERHYYPEGQRVLINNALKRIPDFPIDIILDIGSGSGNSITAALGILPEAKFVATDISPSLLYIMKKRLDENPANRGRVTLACLDVHQPFFKDDSFDLVVGAAILHHLLDPRAAVFNALKAVKPGGAAMFFEPFEYGCTVLKIIHSMILRESDARTDGTGLTQKMRDNLVTLNNDYIFRSGVSGGEKEITKDLDDKWFFTRTFFEDIAREMGAKPVVVFSNHEAKLDTLFEDYMRQNLWLGWGLKEGALPDWCWEIIHDVDISVTNEMKQEFLIEGTVILQK